MENNGCVKIKIETGRLDYYKGDIIVNSTNTDLQLNDGYLFRNLQYEARDLLLEECNRKYPHGICSDQVAVTKGYNLNCKHVFHVALPEYDPSNIDRSCKAVHDVITKCLDLADEYKAKSVAFPPLGCGYLGYPPDIAANIMIKCVFQRDVSVSVQIVSILIEELGVYWGYIKGHYMHELILAKEERKGRSHAARWSSKLKQGCFSASLPHCNNRCTNVLPCGHTCLGYMDDAKCPRCLHWECRPPVQTAETAEDKCTICYTHPLMAAPVCELRCSHVFHVRCLQRIVIDRWVGPRITFNFLRCPTCKTKMTHPLLVQLHLSIQELYDEVSRKAVMRAQKDELDKTPEVTSAESPYYEDVERLALDRYCYYPCSKCGKAYFGGIAQSEDGDAVGLDVDEAEMVCGECSWHEGVEVCRYHRKEFIEYKCMYCCSVAAFFCFGTTHFCNVCYNNSARLRAMDKAQLPKCPAGPNATQLTGTCPLGIKHVPTGEEMCLGCGLCSYTNSF